MADISDATHAPDATLAGIPEERFCPDTEEVTGSNPVSPTSNIPGQRLIRPRRQEPRATYAQDRAGTLSSRKPHRSALVRVRTAPQGLDGSESAVSQSSITTLASGQINGADTIVVELVEADSHPAVVIIRWPLKATVLHPRRFPDTAAVIARLFAEAHTTLAGIKASRRL